MIIDAIKFIGYDAAVTKISWYHVLTGTSKIACCKRKNDKVQCHTEFIGPFGLLSKLGLELQRSMVATIK